MAPGLLSTALAFSACLCCPDDVRAQAANVCDLNQDGVVDFLDVQVAANFVMGRAPCPANIASAGLCDSISWIATAALTGTCPITAAAHSVTLNWIASTSADVIGYNVYRATQTGGPYMIVTFSLVVGTTYTDNGVQAGQTYYYVTTAVDRNYDESPYSNEARATIPAP